MSKRYSAGAIFLQVVPVFANVQRAIEDEAKTIDRALGDQMEKSGEKAGERAGKAASKKMNEELKKGSGEFEREFHKNIDGINQALGGIDTKKLSNDMRREVSQVKKELAGLKDVDITAEADFRRVFEDLHVLQGRILGVRDNVKIVFRSDIDNALKGIAKIAAAKEAVEDPVEIEVRADTRIAERQMGAFEKSFKKTASKAASHLGDAMGKEGRRLRDELKYLENLRIGVDISGNQARKEIGEIRQELRQLSMTHPDIDVRVDAGRAYADLAALEAVTSKLDHDDIDIDVDVHGAAKAVGIMGALGLAGDRGANAFRSFNAVLLAAVSIGPALIPVLGGIAGGLVAIGPAAAVAGAGLGSVLVGFSGLGDAVTALGNQQDQAALTAQTAGNAQETAANGVRNAIRGVEDARRNAARAAEDAAERVADAREAAAEAVEDALERQKDAQEAYRDSVEEVRDAEQALREARQEARGTGAELEREIAGNQLAIDQAMLDAFNATVDFNATQADGSATNAEQEQARINMEEAQLRLKELRAERRELAKEQKKWDKEGVDGTEEVERAQDNLTAAIDAQRDAYERVREAAQAVDEARIEGAENVQDALEAQRETAQDNARAIADAQRAVQQASQGAATSAEALNAQQNAVNNAMDKLGPAGERFARFLFGLREGFYRFRDDIQKVMLPAVQEAIEGFLGSQNAKVARKALIDLAAGFGQFAKALSVSLQGESWGRFFGMLSEFGPDIQEAYGDAFISFMEALAEILVAAAPLALAMAEGLANLMESFADWTRSQAGQEAMKDFFGYIEEIAPELMSFVGALARAFVALVVALEPLGRMVLTSLTDFLNFIADMNPEMLKFIATGVIVSLLLSQIIFGVASMIAGLGSLLTPVGAIVVGLVLLGVALVYLWKTNEDFRDFMTDAWEKISTAVVDAWNKHLKPALDDLWNAIQQLWDEVLAPFLEWLGPILVKVAQVWFPMVMKQGAVMARVLAWTIRNIIVPVFKAMGAIVRWVWEKIAKPVFNFIKNAWENLVDAMQWVWRQILRPLWNIISAVLDLLWTAHFKPILELIGKAWDKLSNGIRWAWRNVLKPVWDYIADKALPKLKSAFEWTVDRIKDIWDNLKKIVGAPIKFVLETVLNGGLIKGFNKVADFVGSKTIDPIPVPKSLQNLHTGGVIGRRSDMAYADGGTLPGYTPGRDVHHFYSPTGGRLNLSGGEAILRPEITEAVGTGFIDKINAAARSGGVAGVRRFFQNSFGGDQGVDRRGHAQNFATGGVFTMAQLAATQAWAKRHDFAPYGWGSAGPSSFDCSGFQSAITNHLRGHSNPYFRLGATASFPWGGFKPGVGQYTIGSTPNYGGSGVGHMAGTVGGLNVESRGGEGVVVGGSARGYSDPGFSQVYHLGANSGVGVGGGKVNSGGGFSFPKWITKIAKNPLNYVKDLVSGPIDKMKDRFDGPIVNLLADVPGKLLGGVKDKIMDILPDPLQSIAEGVGKIGDSIGDGLDNIVPGDGIPGFASGGIIGRDNRLPYNGTMKYDSGGYLPPGLTSVVNLTGKPEPVFTNDQFEDMDFGSGIHYEPHFEGSDLTSEDVAGDLNFQFRRMKRGGKYGGVG